MLENLSDQYDYVGCIDLDSSVLFRNAPFYQGEILYFDERHLNEVGAECCVKFYKDDFRFLGSL